VGGEILDADGATVLEPEQTGVNVRLGEGESLTATYLVDCGGLPSPLATDTVVPITIAEPEIEEDPPVE
jgi:flavin-dependent dehydrogenase